MKAMEINGVTFEVCGTTARNYVKDKDLYDCYGRPSDTKRSIWEDWCIWFNETKIFEYGVSSYNCNFFSINAILRDYNGKDYMMVITRLHNRIYEIVKEGELV